MRRGTSRQKSGKSLAAAIAAVGAAGLGTPRADAGLMFDLRVAGVNGVPSANRKNVQMNVGDTLTLNIVVRVSGTNSFQSVGNFDGAAPAIDTKNDDTFQSIVGAFQSIGGVKGDFQGGANSNQGSGNQLSQFTAGGATNGVAQDFDSDGDLDLGGLGTDPTNMWVARAANPQFVTVSKKNSLPQTRLGTSSGTFFIEDPGGPNTGVPDTRLIDATTSEMLIGELTWIYTSGGGNTNLQFVPRANGDSATALWFEDGVSTGKNPSNSSFSLGTPVIIGLVNAKSLVWNPAGAGGNTNWNNTTSNWLDGANPSAFSDFDFTRFTNAGVGTVNVAPAGVNPAGVEITHTSGTYLFTGGPINGSGAVTINGAGTTIFTVPNGYQFGTFIGGGGTLVVDGGDNRLGAPAGAIQLDNGTLRTQTTGINSTRNIEVRGLGGVFDTNGLDSSVSGNLSGTGAFTKRGAGTLILTADNSHTGPKTIEAGTLQLGNNSNTGSIVGNITDNGNLTIFRFNNSVYSGQISGSGSFTTTGLGQLTLTGNSTFTGGTTINNGALLLGNGGNTGSIVGNVLVTGSTSLWFNRSDNLTFAGDISGGGVVNKLGAGVLTFLGTNTYTGVTTISGGTLQIGNGGTTGSIAGNITDNTALIFNRSNDLSYGGAISGIGSLTKLGAGKLVLTGTSTYTGGTSLLDGTLQLGNGGTTGSIAGNVFGAGTLAFNRSNNLTFGGTISGGTSVVKDGTGALTLTGSNSQISTTVVNGTLRVASNANLGLEGAFNFLDLRGGATLKLDGPVSMSRAVLLGDGTGTATLDATGQSLGFTGGGGTGFGGPVVIAGGTVSFNRSGGLVGVSPGSSITVNPGATLNLSGSPVLSDGVDRVDVINNSTASFNVIAGTHEAGQLNGSGNTNISVGATLSATHVRQSELTVYGKVVIRPDGGSAGVSRVGTLNLATQLDLTDNKLIVTNNPAGSWNGAAYTDISGLIQSGRNGEAQPLWDGNGIVTSEWAAQGNLTSIGVAKATEVKPASATATDLWAGQTITGTDALVMYTYGGDANLDGKLNIDDYVRIDVGIVLGLKGWANGDFNYDGKINIDDYSNFIDANIGNQSGIFYTAGNAPAGVSAIPEPGIGLLTLFGPALLMRRRRGSRA